MTNPNETAVFTSPQAVGKLKNKYLTRLQRLAKSDADFLRLLEIFSNSKNVFGGISRRELKTYSADFIVEIENVLPSLENIVNDPQRFIKEEAEVVGIEKARKITYRSVEHMAKHSENIRTVESNGKIEPRKVLNMYIDDELTIYENRFIMTLVRRLQMFIELRYKYISEHSDTRNSDVVTMSSEVKIGDAVYQYETKMKIIVPSDDAGHRAANEDLLNRLVALRKRVAFLATSRFMLEMRKVMPITDPVQQTNIMRLNYDYQNAYRLWTFINRYDVLGIDYKFTQSKVDFDNEYITKLMMNSVGAYLMMKTEHSIIMDKDSKTHLYKPRFVDLKPDLDMLDSRLIGKGVSFGVTAQKETPAQIEARKRRQEQAIERRRKRELDKQKAKELVIQKREAAKRLAAQKLLDKKEKDKQHKLMLQERKRQAALAIAEKKQFEQLKKEELQKLQKAREQVRSVAIKKKETEGK